MDLDTIWDSIAVDQPLNADRFIDQLHSRLELIASAPNMGRPWLGEQIGIRFFPFRRYGIFYMPKAFGIEVVRVLHHAREIPTGL